jgi:hypothetical protein
MLQCAPEPSGPWLEYALMKSAWPEERAVALLLFDYLTEPQAAPGPSFAVPGGSRTEIRLRGGQWPLEQAWEQVFAPRLDVAAGDLIAIADRHLRRAHALLTATGTARPGWDPASFSRSAIEPHSQDDMPEPLDILIDAARDSLEVLLGAGSPAGIGYLAAWADADSPLLRRLALHGWAYRRDVDAAVKLEWLRDRHWLFDHQLRHEVFTLIAATISHVPTALADAVVADAAAGPAGSAHQDYEAYNALAWITRHAPGLDSARDAFRQAQANHHEYAVRTHPDLASWMETSGGYPQPPVRPADLHRLISANPVTALADLRARISASQGPSWEDALGLISDTVREWPDDGLALLDGGTSVDQDVFHAIALGWGASANTGAVSEAIIDRLARADAAIAGRSIARLLAGTDRPPATAEAWNRLPSARRLAALVWSSIPGTSSLVSAAGWLTDAINHPAGQLAQFWVKTVAADWQAAGDAWSGLSEDTREHLEAMLATNDGRGVIAEIIFASQLHFFRAADPGWCLDHVLPLLSWADTARAQRTWSGFLAWGRFDDQLLSGGLLGEYIQAAAHIGELPQRLHGQLYRHLSAVALHRPDPSAREWARALTSSVDAPIRTAWMSQVGRDMSPQPPQAVEEHWLTWMRGYWDDRLSSIPTRLTLPEASAMATWVIYLTASLKEGMAKATSAPAGIPEHSRLLQDLTSERITAAPSAVATFVAHLLSNTDSPFYECDQIQRIIQEVGDTPSTEKISEEALRLHCL